MSSLVCGYVETKAHEVIYYIMLSENQQTPQCDSKQ